MELNANLSNVLEYNELMKTFQVLFVFFLFFSCQNKQEGDAIIINLDNVADKLAYSTFVDSVSYVTLHLEDDMHIGSVERLYKWGDYYYVLGSHQSGIFVFDVSGKLYSHIDAFGEGPKNFRIISSFSVVKSTGDICIMDYASRKLMLFGMDGSFKNSFPCSNWSVDLASFNVDSTVFISPFYVGGENPSGIWLADENNVPVRFLRNDVTSDHQLYYFPMTYNWGDTCIYYYDRNWNDFSSVSPNGIRALYHFDVKQKMKPSIMRDATKNPSLLNGYSICDRFVYSSSCLLLLYCKFVDLVDRSYVWAIVDNSGHVKLGRNLYNDIDDVRIETRELFHLDDMTLGRICEEEADNFDVQIQLLHLSDEVDVR